MANSSSSSRKVSGLTPTEVLGTMNELTRAAGAWKPDKAQGFCLNLAGTFWREHVRPTFFHAGVCSRQADCHSREDLGLSCCAGLARSAV
jgi:hypothetical protein